MNADELRQLLAEALQAGSQGAGGPRAGANFEETIKNFEMFGRSLKQNNGVLGTVNKLIAGQNASWTSVKNSLKELDEQITKTESQAEKTQLLEQRKQIANRIYVNNTIASAANFGRAITKSAADIGSGVTTAMGNLAKNLQGSGSDFQAIGSLFNNLAGTAGGVIQGLSSGIQNFGQFLTRFGPVGLMVGTGLNVLGAAAGAAAGALVKLGGFVVEVLVTELEKTQRAFFNVSRAGAIFSDGMMGLRTAANSGMLTIEQFASVVSKHSQDIVSAGLGMTEGSKRLGGALAAGGSNLRRELFNLGFSFEEQGGLVAETMRMIAASGDPLRVSNTVLAKQTQEYAQNVRMMANYTGEDLRRKAEESRKQETTIAFQAKLDSMEASERANFQSKFRVLNPQMQQNVMDMMVFGTVINKTGASLMAVNEPYARSIKSVYQGLTNAQVRGVAGMEQIIATNRDAVRRAGLSNQALAAAQAAGLGGLVGDIASATSNEIEYLRVRTEENRQRAERATVEGMRTEDELQQNAFKIADGMQSLRLLFEKFLGDNMGVFVSTMSEFLPVLATTLRDLAVEFSKLKKEMMDAGGFLKWLEGKTKEVTGPNPMEKADKALTIAGALAGALTGAQLGATIGAGTGSVVLPVVGAVPGALIGALIGLIGGGVLGGLGGSSIIDSSQPKKAMGGPVSPFKTYLVGERGPELLSMGDMGGQVIPNTKLTAEADNLNSQEIKMLLQELVRETKYSTDQVVKQVEKLEDIRNYNQQMLSNSY